MPLIGVVNGRARARRAKRRVGPTTPWLPHLSEVFAEIKEEVKKRVRPKSAPGFRMAEMLYNDVHEGTVTGWHVLQPARVHPGLPADLVAAYAPPPPRPSTASRRRDEGAEAGGGTPRAGSPTNQKAMAAQLRQPALQAALASALWQVLHEHNGQQLLATPVPK